MFGSAEAAAFSGADSPQRSLRVGRRYNPGQPTVQSPSPFRRISRSMKPMAWVVYYRDEINKRDVISSEISTREAALDQACLLLRERFTVGHIAGPNNRRIHIAEIREWCGKHKHAP
jgi:hypothetical protein